MTPRPGPSRRFVSWVKNYGINPLARQLGAQRSSVYRWIDRENPLPPRVETARRLILLSRERGRSKERLTYDDIYGRVRASRPLEGANVNAAPSRIAPLEAAR